jgi:hypothetical protein
MNALLVPMSSMVLVTNLVVIAPAVAYAITHRVFVDVSKDIMVPHVNTKLSLVKRFNA